MRHVHFFLRSSELSSLLTLHASIRFFPFFFITGFLCKTTTEAGCGASEMAQEIKMLAPKPDYLGLSPRFHRMEREN